MPRTNGYWDAGAPVTNFPQLTSDVTVDIAIIGGGIVGITAARVLKDRGLSVAVVEARKVGRQVTGKSTAKVTSQHRIIYQTLEQKFGERHARLYAEAQEQGVKSIKEFVSSYRIDCDLEPRPAYTYTTEEKHVSEIGKEVETAKRLGLPASLVRETGLPFEVFAAMRFDNQAQFHPTKYTAGLAQTIPGDGSHVFENSRVTDWKPTRIGTERGRVSAKHVIMATHLPLGQVGGYYAKAHPYAEPVIAARIGRAPPGMYISVEQPSHSIRSHEDSNGHIYGIAAGTSFKPGSPDEERKNFAELEQWLKETWDAREIEYRWVNEDYRSMDDAPFIGWSAESGDRYLVATGFRAWGISNGTAAGFILADLAAGRDNTWTELFDANRTKPLAGTKQFVKGNVEAAAQLIGGYLSRRPKSFDDLAAGQAAILKVDGEDVAAFRDEQGQLHAVSAACSHMGCIVGWNETDRTWDCGCHGSRFELSGAVIHGPAVHPLDSKIKASAKAA